MAQPYHLWQNSKRGFTYREMTKAFMQSLRGAVQQDLLELQRKQLFEQSVDIYGDPLGWYRSKNKSVGGKIRKAGSRYEMFNTGQLFEKMQVKINIGKREIEFINRRKDLEKPSFRTNLDVFNSEDWFGLTPEHFTLFLEEYCLPWVIQWTKQKILYGGN